MENGYHRCLLLLGWRGGRLVTFLTNHSLFMTCVRMVNFFKEGPNQHGNTKKTIYECITLETKEYFILINLTNIFWIFLINYSLYLTGINFGTADKIMQEHNYSMLTNNNRRKSAHLGNSDIHIFIVFQVYPVLLKKVGKLNFLLSDTEIYFKVWHFFFVI